MIWPPCWNFDTQMLQPMHSRISSTRPSEILVGRNGSAIDGRAAPMMSSTPARINPTMSSGLVRRPLPTTGMADPKNRLALLDEWRHPTGFAKARGARILAPFGIVADLQRHRVDHAFPAKRLEHAYAILAGLDAFRAVQSVDLEARRDAAATPESALQRVQQLDVEPRAVLKAAAVMIRAPVEARFEKLDGQSIVARPRPPADRIRLVRRACRLRRTC